MLYPVWDLTKYMFYKLKGVDMKLINSKCCLRISYKSMEGSAFENKMLVSQITIFGAILRIIDKSKFQWAAKYKKQNKQTNENKIILHFQKVQDTKWTTKP